MSAVIPSENPPAPPTSAPSLVASGAPMPSSLPAWFPPLFYLLLAMLFLWRSTFAGEVFLPAGMLGHVAPWSVQATPETLPPWNPLRWDGIAQFYPWRRFAAETLQSGSLPLWNPYQFCGTPFVANSQSAVFYPPNLLFTLLPTARAFGASALLHLTLCGWLTYLLLRRLRCAPTAALLGGVVYAYSAWQVAWMQLPTFLATSCWFPLLLRQIHVVGYSGIQVFRYSGRQETSMSALEQPNHPTPAHLNTRIPEYLNTGGLGALLGLMLLAGHLQIAFYGLLAGSLWAIGVLIQRGRKAGTGAFLRGLFACLGGLTLGVMFATPQILPSLELSRVSHRVGKPTAEGYQAYTEYGLQSSGLVTLTLPNFFGGDTDSDHPYWGFYVKRLSGSASVAIRHNAAETALFVGVVPLLLGILALLRCRKRANGYVLFFGGLAALALLLALGTAVNALFYFGVPGFGQSGSPARALVLWAFAWAALAGFGLDTLLRHPPSKREIGVVLGIFALVFLAGLGMAHLIWPPYAGVTIPAEDEAFARVGLGWIKLAVAVLGGAALLLPMARRILWQKEGMEGGVPALVPGALVLVIAELFVQGMQVNPTAKPETVYPETPGIALLRERVGHERIFPVNQLWSLYKSPPAVLPPNAATVYGLRDVQGYDSLLTGQYKAFANQFARPNLQGALDASPPEVGNMVFFQNPNAPLVPLTAAAFALTPATSSPAFTPEAAPPGSPLYNADNEMAVYALPNARARASLSVANGSVTWKEDTPTRVTLEISAPDSATLNLADQFYPGWKAAVDGSPVPITRQQDASLFRAVLVPAGRHTVAFRYEPASFRLGLYLACFAALLLALAGTFSRKRKGLLKTQG